MVVEWSTYTTYTREKKKKKELCGGVMMSTMMMTVVEAAWASTHYTVMIVKQVQKVRESATAAMELMEENTFITMCIIIGLERERERKESKAVA